jgi:hypothetical protein
VHDAAGDRAEGLRQDGLVAGAGVDAAFCGAIPAGRGNDCGHDGGDDGPAGDHGDDLPRGHANRFADAEVVDTLAGGHEYGVEHAESGGAPPPGA